LPVLICNPALRRMRQVNCKFEDTLRVAGQTEAKTILEMKNKVGKLIPQNILKS
jgi:hypothetical protein